MFIVYTECVDIKNFGRYFYGCYDNQNKANEIAKNLGNDFPWFHCVCNKEEAKALKIENLPF